MNQECVHTFLASWPHCNRSEQFKGSSKYTSVYDAQWGVVFDFIALYAVLLMATSLYSFSFVCFPRSLFLLVRHERSR